MATSHRHLAMATIALAAACCERPVAAPPTGPPRLHFEETQADLGEIPVTSDGWETRFALLNHGFAPLEISTVEVGCGCMDVEVPRSTLGPSERGSIIVRVRADRAGEKSSFVLVHSSDPVNPRLRLDIRWRAVAPLEFEPLALNLRILRPDSVVEHRVGLKRSHVPDGRDCRILRVEPPSDSRLTARLAGVTDGTPTVTVKLAAGVQKGRHRAQVRVSLSQCWSDQLVLPVEWVVRDVIDITPQRLMLGFGRPGEHLEKRVVVSSDPDHHLAISEPGIERQAWASARILESSRSVAVISVTARLPDAPGEHCDELQIECSSPQERTISLPVSVVVLGNG